MQIFKQKTIESLLADLRKLATQYSQLAHDGRTDTAGTLQQAVKRATDRCDALRAELTGMEQQLNATLNKKKSFDATLDGVRRWLTSLDKQLGRIEKSRDKRQRAFNIQVITYTT